VAEPSEAARKVMLDVLYAGYARTPVLQELAAGRRLVMPAGPLNAPFAVIGEAPGEKEASRGEPFVGPSGALLIEMFSGAALPWRACYRTNVVPWRPDGNRTPYPFQVQASYGRLAREMEIVSPAVIIAAGAVAWDGITQGDFGRFAEARWTWWRVQGRRLLCIPHPAAILRCGSGKEQDEMLGKTVRALREVRIPA